MTFHYLDPEVRAAEPPAESQTMNLDQAIDVLTALKSVAAPEYTATLEHTGPPIGDGRLVLVRGDRSGVFYGRAVVEDGRTVELTDARHVWSWSGALNVADLAERGPSGGKITGPTGRIRVLDAIEVCDVTNAARARFEAVTPWQS